MSVDSGARAGRRGKGDGGVLQTVAAVLVCAGLLLSVVLLIAAVHDGAAFADVLGMVSSLVAYAGLGYYCTVGYRTGDVRAFLVATYAVATMFFFKALMPSAGTFGSAVLILAFGLTLVFAERVDEPSGARITLAATVVVLALGALVTMVMPAATLAPTLVAVLGRLIPWTHVVCEAVLLFAFEEQVA